MTATPVLSGVDAAAQHISLQEWIKLRRHPRPEFCFSLQDLPQHLLEIAQPWLPPDRSVQGALVLPGEYYARKKMHWEWVPERALIFLEGAALHVTSEDEDAPSQVMLVDASALLYVRSSLVLLYGLIEFKADCGAQARAVRLEYNTVIWDALKGPLTQFVAAASPRTLSMSPAEAKAANVSILRRLPFKFANGLQYYALDAGEVLHSAIFQPALWERRGLLPREVTPNTLLALTDRKVVLIEETRSSFWHRQPPRGEYGWIFTYIPRDRVIDMVIAKGVRWTELRMRLEWGNAKDERTLLLEPSTARQWDEAWRVAHHY